MTALAQLFIYCNMAVMEDVASVREVGYLRSDVTDAIQRLIGLHAGRHIA